MNYISVTLPNENKSISQRETKYNCNLWNSNNYTLMKWNMHNNKINNSIQNQTEYSILLYFFFLFQLLKKKFIANLEEQLRLLNCFYLDLPIELRESQQTKKLSYISYNNYKSNYDEYVKQIENKRTEMLDTLDRTKSELDSMQQNYQTLLSKIKQAQQTLIDQEKTIKSLDEQNDSLKYKLYEQRKVVIDLQVLQKLERLYLTFEEPINDEFQYEDINKMDCQKQITDFMHTHPFGVSFLVENLIQQYRKFQVSIDSEASLGQDLMEDKKELQQELKELIELSSKFHIFEEGDDIQDTKFQDQQKLMGLLTMVQSQNNFKQNLLYKAESFIIKVFGNLYNAIKRFNDIFQAIHQKRMAIDLRSSQIDSKIKNFCANIYIGHQSLSLYQFQSNPLTQSYPDLYSQIQNSIILKLYVNEDALNQFLQTGSAFLKLYLKASDYYSNQIHAMMDLIHSITFIPKRKFYYNDSSPQQINYKSKISMEMSQKKITLRTDTESRNQMQINFKTKTTKRNSFTSTIGSTRRIQQDLNESNYLEMERQKIINPQNNTSNFTRIPSEQQRYCDMLSERGQGKEKKAIISNFKSLIKLRKIKRSFRTNPLTPKSIIGAPLFFKSTYK